VRFGRLVVPPWILVALLGSVLRIGFIASQPEELTRDRDAYLGIARCVARGAGFCAPDSTRPTAYRPPVYPMLLGLVLSVLPESIAVAALNCVCYLLTCWLVARLSGSLRDDEWDKWLQGVAVAVVAFDPLLISYSGQPMTESLATLLATGWVVAVHWLLSGRVSKPSSNDEAIDAATYDWPRRSLLMLGGLTGVLALCRPSFLPLVLATEVVVLFAGVDGRQRRSLARLLLVNRFRSLMQRNRPIIPERTSCNQQGFGIIGGDRGRLRRVWPRLVGAERRVLVLVGGAMVLAPWTARNWWLLGEPIVATTHGGYTLLLANNEVFQREVIDRGWGGVWQEESFSAWQQDVEARLAHFLPVPQSEVSRDEAMQRMARDWMDSHRVEVARGVLFRWAQFWGMTPQGETQPGLVVVACSIWYGAVFSLAVVGLLRGMIGWRTWRSRLVPAGLLLAVLMATHAFYWTNARMRAPLVPVMGMLVVKGIAHRDVAEEADASEERGIV
jgi:hypothetical protein